VVTFWTAWLLSAALGHDGACPGLGQLEVLAARGPLPDTVRTCVVQAAIEAPRVGQWLLWRDDLAREGASVRVIAELDALLTPPIDLDRTLAAGEALAAVDPVAAARALAVARAHSGGWAGPVQRTDRLARLERALAASQPAARVRLARGLADAGALGPALDQAHADCSEVAPAATCASPRPFDAVAAPPPTAQELAPCADIGALWTRAVWRRAYATDRDALTRALDGMVPGAGREASARLALRLAVVHRDALAAALIARRVFPILPDDPSVLAIARALHERYGDKEGPRWWADQTAEHADRTSESDRLPPPTLPERP
jgi:hypothetical protein